jgi:hypothetical protein
VVETGPGSAIIRWAVRRLVAILFVLALSALAPAAAWAAGGTSIFYYPWWGTPKVDGRYLHWNYGTHVPPGDLASNFYPARGAYSSMDAAVLRQQMKEIAAAGVDELISSWWGWGSPEDIRLPTVISAAKKKGLTVAVHLEPYEKWLRTADVVRTDLGHVEDVGVRRVYVYRPFDDLISDAEWSEITAAFPSIEFYAQTQDVTRAAKVGFVGVYTYDVLSVHGASFAGLCFRARAAGLSCAPSVGPGYNGYAGGPAEGIRRRRGGRTYDSMWRAAIAADADRVTITSYNEWHEGTQIEPARRHAPSPFGPYETYERAYGRTGRRAETAYLDRTAYWTKAYRLTSARHAAFSVLAALGVTQ